MKIRLSILTGLLLLVSFRVQAVPVPDITEAISSNDFGTNEAMRAYQDSDDKYLWYYLPLRFEIKKRMDPRIGKVRLSFIHSFFNFFDETKNAEEAFSYYSFTFVPYQYSSQAMDALKIKIAARVSRQLAPIAVGPHEVRLSPMPLSNVYYKIDLPQGSDKMGRYVQYVNVYGEDDGGVSVYEMYSGVPVELTVDEKFEPTFSRTLITGFDNKQPLLEVLKVVFKGRYQLLKASAEVNYQKLFEFAERSWDEPVEKGWWVWKRVEHHRRTVVELANESLDTGIKYDINIDRTLDEKVIDKDGDDRVMEKPLHQYVREQLAQEIAARAFDIQKVVDGEEEKYRVSERAGTKSITKTTSVNFNTTVDRKVIAKGIFLSVDGLTADLFDPSMAKYLQKKGR